LFFPFFSVFAVGTPWSFGQAETETETVSYVNSPGFLILFLPILGLIIASGTRSVLANINSCCWDQKSAAIYIHELL